MRLSKVFQILVVSLALAGYAAWVRQTREQPPLSRLGEVPAPGIPLIRLAEAERLWKNGTALFVDARSSSDFQFGHIPGAVHVSEENYADRFPGLAGRLRRARRVVVYCKSRDCGASLWMAIRLRNAGLTNVCIFPGGWNEWYLGRLPTVLAAR